MVILKALGRFLKAAETASLIWVFPDRGGIVGGRGRVCSGELDMEKGMTEKKRGKCFRLRQGDNVEALCARR